MTTTEPTTDQGGRYAFNALVAALHREAHRRDWCAEYEVFVRKLNHQLPPEWQIPVGDRMRITVDIDCPRTAGINYEYMLELVRGHINGQFGLADVTIVNASVLPRSVEATQAEDALERAEALAEVGVQDAVRF